MLEMEPHRHIVHNRKKHIEFYVRIYVSMFLCGSKKMHFDLSWWSIVNIQL